MVNVGPKTFLKESNSLIQKLPEAAYVSINLQTSGVSIPKNRKNNKQNNTSSSSSEEEEQQQQQRQGTTSQEFSHNDTPNERYQKLRHVPERYSIIQVGISLFVENPEFRSFRMGISNDENIDNSNQSNDENDADDEEEEDSDEQQNLEGGGERQQEVEHEENDGDSSENEDDSSHDDNDDDSRDEGMDHNNDDGDNGLIFDDDDSSIDTNIEPPEFLVLNYKFYICPQPNKDGSQSSCSNSDREVTLNPTTIDYLNKHGIDFNKWLRGGTPYTLLDEMGILENEFKERYSKKEEAERQRETTDEKIRRARVKPVRQPSSPEDIAFVGRTMANLREWIDSAAPIPQTDEFAYRSEFGISHVLEPCSKFQRQCLEDSIENEYPSLIVERFLYDENRLCVLRLNAEEKKDRDKRLKREEWDRMQLKNIGFTRVFKALSDACRGELGEVGDLDDEYAHFWEENEAAGSNSNGISDYYFPKGSKSHLPKRRGRRIPLVVHNGFMDLLFLMTHFHSHSLPSTFAEAKSLIHHYFPVVYDTKILASECSDLEIRESTTSLIELYDNNCIRIEGENGVEQNRGGDIVPRITLLNSENIINTSTEIHMYKTIDESFMSGAVFQCLCRRILRGIDSVQNNWAHANVGSLLFLDESHYLSRFSRLFGENKLFLTQTFQSIDLENEGSDEPLVRGMNSSTTFQVSGLTNTSNSAKDIAQVLRQARSTDVDVFNPHDRTWFQILPIDDHSMFVFARAPEHLMDSTVIARLSSLDSIAEDTERKVERSLEKRGEMIVKALVSQFPTQSIITLKEHLSNKEKLTRIANNASKRKKRSTISETIFNVFGIFKRTDTDDENSDIRRPLKRRRVD